MINESISILDCNAPDVPNLIKFNDFPKIILYKNYVYIYAKTKTKSREIEEVLKLHVLVLLENCNNVNFLKEDELSYLLNWDAEKYRQNK